VSRRAQKAFSKYDSNGNGHIDVREFRNLLRDLQWCELLRLPSLPLLCGCVMSLLMVPERGWRGCLLVVAVYRMWSRYWPAYQLLDLLFFPSPHPAAVPLYWVAAGTRRDCTDDELARAQKILDKDGNGQVCAACFVFPASHRSALLIHSGLIRGVLAGCCRAPRLRCVIAAPLASAAWSCVRSFSG
jgi:hypothetical protein